MPMTSLPSTRLSRSVASNSQRSGSQNVTGVTCIPPLTHFLLSPHKGHTSTRSCTCYRRTVICLLLLFRRLLCLFLLFRLNARLASRPRRSLPPSLPPSPLQLKIVRCHPSRRPLITAFARPFAHSRTALERCLLEDGACSRVKEKWRLKNGA